MWKKRLSGCCCSNDLPPTKNDTFETVTIAPAKRMTTIMEWQIYACSHTHSHGHNNIKRNFWPHKLWDHSNTRIKNKIHTRKNTYISHYNPNSSVVRFCDSWDMEYVKWFGYYQKDANANTYASHDNGIDASINTQSGRSYEIVIIHILTHLLIDCIR